MTATKTTTKVADKLAPKSSAPKPAAVVEHPSLAAALAAFQGECPPIRKGNTATVPTKNGGQYTYDYATLSDVLEVVNPVLARHGLSLMTKLTVTKHGFGIKYKLRHVSGESDGGFYPMPDPVRTPPQDMGAVQTYNRRHVVCSILGVAPGGDDDDAQTAQAHAAENRQRAASRAAQPPRTAAPAAPAALAVPRRDFAAEASKAAGDYGRLTALWQEARAAQEPVTVLDEIAALGRAAAPAPDEASDPGNPEDEEAAPAGMPADVAPAAEAVPA